MNIKWSYYVRTGSNLFDSFFICIMIYFQVQPNNNLPKARLFKSVNNPISLGIEPVNPFLPVN